jgi:hypothetical protein
MITPSGLVEITEYQVPAGQQIAVLPPAKKGQRGGAKAGIHSGRKSKLTEQARMLATTEIALKSDNPAMMMYETARFFAARADKLLAEADTIDPDSVRPASSKRADVKIAHERRSDLMIQKQDLTIQGLRSKIQAHVCATDLAPFVHSKPQAAQVDGREHVHLHLHFSELDNKL